MAPMKRILADFNTLGSAPVDLVKLAAPRSWQERQLPHVQQGERVVLYDHDGLEVEGVVEHRGVFCLATRDWDTIKRVETVNESFSQVSLR